MTESDETMTVKQVIEALSKFPEDTEVWREGDGTSYRVYGVSIHRIDRLSGNSNPVVIIGDY